MSGALPADAVAPNLFIPPRPTWAREDIHRRFWAAVTRAVAREVLPAKVWADDPDAEMAEPGETDA